MPILESHVVTLATAGFAWAVTLHTFIIHCPGNASKEEIRATEARCVWQHSSPIAAGFVAAIHTLRKVAVALVDVFGVYVVLFATHKLTEERISLKIGREVILVVVCITLFFDSHLNGGRSLFCTITSFSVDFGFPLLSASDSLPGVGGASGIAEPSIIWLQPGGRRRPRR